MLRQVAWKTDQIGSRIPGARVGSIEVRPVWEMAAVPDAV